MSRFIRLGYLFLALSVVCVSDNRHNPSQATGLRAQRCMYENIRKGREGAGDKLGRNNIQGYNGVRGVAKEKQWVFRFDGEARDVQGWKLGHKLTVKCLCGH